MLSVSGKLVHRQALILRPLLLTSRIVFRLRSSAPAAAMTAFGTDKGLELFTTETPNGYKASIALEYLGLPYHVTRVDLSANEQKSDFFLERINPNGRIPALVDHDAGDVNVFESGAILLYLAEHFDAEHKLLPKDRLQRAHTLSWLNWQMGGLGPMLGQANHFIRFAPEKVEYGINRYRNETLRLLKVLDAALEGRDFLVGDSLTAADIASYPWVYATPWSLGDFDFEGLPHLKAWHDRIGAHPAVQRGMAVPNPSPMADAMKDPAKMKAMVEGAQAIMVSAKKE